jgi:hypothetical protein
VGVLDGNGVLAGTVGLKVVPGRCGVWVVVGGSVCVFPAGVTVTVGLHPISKRQRQRMKFFLKVFFRVITMLVRVD